MRRWWRCGRVGPASVASPRRLGLASARSSDGSGPAISPNGAAGVSVLGRWLPAPPTCEPAGRRVVTTPHRSGRNSVSAATPAATEGSTYTPRQVCWLLLKAPDDLTPDEAAYVTRLYHTCPQVALAEALTKEFATVLRERDVDGLYTWLRRAEASGIKELQGGARSLWLDRQAVEAAVRCDWSNGPVEGKVNKLKTTKRAQYGRATFDLLRRRVLHAA